MKKSYQAHLESIKFPPLASENTPKPSEFVGFSASKNTKIPPISYPGPKFSRQDLEILASGKISSKFGAWFAELDCYDRLIRMPQPPLLLADRVLGIDAEPGSIAKGTIWTETDVVEGSWYLHQGRMPLSTMMEAGQADLLLSSWLGFDFYNRGERVYRLLGCEIAFFDRLPKVGDKLYFEINITGHARQGDIRLFFFHYDCYVNGKLCVKLRSGQAGFFSYEELENSAGVLWDPKTAKYDASKPVEPPRINCEFNAFTSQQIEKYAKGDPWGCFGTGFESLKMHRKTPSIPDGYLKLIDSVTCFDPTGGPWKRGYIRAVQKITPTDWFFDSHFKNDPCMPGTLMLEAGLQTMMIYMAAIGYTLDKDGWRFEPAANEYYKFICRGQITPLSQEVIYEAFVFGCELKPFPALHVNLLATVDGLKSFHTQIVMRLVPEDFE